MLRDLVSTTGDSPRRRPPNHHIEAKDVEIRFFDNLLDGFYGDFQALHNLNPD